MTVTLGAVAVGGQAFGAFQPALAFADAGLQNDYKDALRYLSERNLFFAQQHVLGSNIRDVTLIFENNPQGLIPKILHGYIEGNALSSLAAQQAYHKAFDAWAEAAENIDWREAI